MSAEPPIPAAVMSEMSDAPRPPKRPGRPPRSRGAPKSSDDAADRWTIRGVPLNVRTSAVRAAAERGLPVGDLVAEALARFLRQEPADRRVIQADEPKLPEVVTADRFDAALADINDRLMALAERQTELDKRRRWWRWGR